jgi:lipopolysaccharide/colanic/teichoic acid biosynthesis glycosyltransferase
MKATSSNPRVTRPARLRRTLDVLGASLLLLLASPALLAGIAIVWLGGGRPVFFGHLRLGLGGRPFHCWKLRTMSVDAEAELDRRPELKRLHRSNGFKLPNASDPRVTRWGRLLRRTYVDEIPQLLNVLSGSMSLVGPRPIVPSELDLFGPAGETLLEVRPGVFGAWNSLGRSRPPYPERARLELEYVRRARPLDDLRILGRSVLAVLQGQGDE